MAEFIKKGLSNDNPHVSEFFSGVEIERNRSAPPGSAGVPPAKIAAKMAALPGKGRGAERLRLKQQHAASTLLIML